MHNNSEEDNSIDFRKIFDKMAEKWPWFIVSILICLGLSYLYTVFTVPAYQINARVLVNDDEKGGGVAKQASALMDLGGIMGSKNSVDNEVEILKTRFLMEQVVRKMQLNIIYYKQSGLLNKEIYKAPFKVNIISSEDTIKTTKIGIKSTDQSVSINSKPFKGKVIFGKPFYVKGVGTIELIRESGLKLEDVDYSCVIMSIDERVSSLMKQLSVSVTNKQVSIIDLGFLYSIPKKGEDILNKIITQYTEANLSDKNAIADSTSKFIKERLLLIASELGDFENKVEAFKERNQLADMSEQGKVLIQSTGEFSTELAKAETQVSIINDLENYMRDEAKNKRIFPASLLPQDMVFSQLMAQYNALLIERDKQLLSVTEESPFIQNIDKQIEGLKSSILSNIESTKNTFLLTRNKLRNQLSKAQSQISGVPQVEKNYLKLARNRDIKQELYIFLMQKAEETAISKTSNLPVAKVIDPPKSEINPVSPKKKIIMLMGLVIGLFIPLVIIFILNLLQVTISSKDDITNLTNAPIIGEITHSESSDNMIVANHSRSAISEQFRALRTNLTFYLNGIDEKIIVLTSSMSGEGKSFTAINLANIFALSGKKVLLMELDLRRPGLSNKLGIDNKIGFSSYTINPQLKIDDIIKPLNIHQNVFLMPSGPLPPNPAETLMNQHVPNLVSELKKQFDYIIMDAPPIGVITDAQLLSEYADATIYLVRQNFTKKDQLKIVNDLYYSKKMKNVGIVVNDIKSKTYGYGYDYGSYGEERKSNWVKRFFKRG